MRRKRLNVTRRAGGLFFRRETSRLSDGTPWGEVLWIMSSDSKPRRCICLAYRPIGDGPPELWYHNGGTYTHRRGLEFRREVRAYLAREA